MLRAGLVAALAMAMVGFAGAAHAGESPIAFNLAQASPPAKNAPYNKVGHSRQNRNRRAVGFARQRMTIISAPSNEGEKINTPPSDVVREAARWLGSGNFTGRPGAWCAWAVSAWLTQTGHRPLASGMAASALTYGPRLAAARVGALAVLSSRRGSASHVGLVRRVEGDNIELISGNWGHRVAIAIVPRRRILAFIGV
jgi:uncharacterized protein (TIGR02594 family)